MTVDRRQSPDRREEPRVPMPGRREVDALWVSVRHYCALYDVNRATVYKYLEMGLLTSWQVGRVLRVKNEPPQDTKAQRSVGGR